jgi:hypothetical protein
MQSLTETLLQWGVKSEDEAERKGGDVSSMVASS